MFAKRLSRGVAVAVVALSSFLTVDAFGASAAESASTRTSTMFDIFRDTNHHYAFIGGVLYECWDVERSSDGTTWVYDHNVCVPA